MAETSSNGVRFRLPNSGPIDGKHAYEMAFNRPAADYLATVSLYNGATLIRALDPLKIVTPGQRFVVTLNASEVTDPDDVWLQVDMTAIPEVPADPDGYAPSSPQSGVAYFEGTIKFNFG